MTRQRADEWTGRDVLNLAYSWGCLFQLGERWAKEAMLKLAEESARNAGARYGIVTQFRMGQHHETLRGPAVEVSP